MTPGTARSAIIDGEVVVPAADGSTDFSVLQNELKGQSTKIVLVAFDLFYLNGHDLRKLPLVERKAQLKKVIQHTDIQFSESFEIDGAKVFAHACKVGLEGMVSKVRIAVMFPAAVTTGLRKPAPSARR
jgi:bifunctional non-homologous end joining protein LigD